MKTYLWIEDSREKAGYIFWQTLMGEIYPDVIVESKKNSSELVKAVKALSDTSHRYIIVYDNSFDNLQIYQERKRLKQYVDGKDNVLLMDVICFEYILLEFDDLLNWIYGADDEFLIKRAGAVRARNRLVETLRLGELDYKVIQEVAAYDNRLENHNIEQLSAKLLFDLTRNTGFEVSKGRIGDCWILSCCEWKKRQNDDLCGLDEKRLSLTEKMKSIYMGTSLREEFLNIGLEASLC